MPIDRSILDHAKNPLNIPTYDDAPEDPNQCTHPDIVEFETPWAGYKYWMIFTPNRTGTSQYENPSIVASNDNVTWEIPAVVGNPIYPPPPSVQFHNSDADIVYNSKTDELYGYWIYSNDAYNGKTYLKMKKISKIEEGVTVGETIDCLTTRERYGLLSPAVVYDDKKDMFYCWYVNTGEEGYTNPNNTVEYIESKDGIHWSYDSPVVIESYMASGLSPWHTNVKYIPERDEYWSITHGFPVGTNPDVSALYFGISKDGKNWKQYPRPLLEPSERGHWDDKQVYRSYISYDSSSDMMKVWYSALGYAKSEVVSSIWKIGYTEGKLDDILKILDNTNNAAPPPPPLDEEFSTAYKYFDLYHNF